MAGYRHNPTTGQREYVSDDAPAEAPVSGLPMREPGWVENFLNGPIEGLPFRISPRPSSHRARRRGPRRRG